MVIIPVSDQLRHVDFFSAFTRLRVPAGSMTGIARSASITTNLNLSLERMKPEHEWAFIMGDDHVFEPDLLERLLDLHVDVAVPLCVKRAPPFTLVIMRELLEETLDGYPAYMPYMPSEVPPEPFTVVAAGSAGMLIRRRVIDALDPPYFENTDGASSNEDLTFCAKVTAAGFDITCHPQVLLGHIGQMQVWPHWHNGQLAVMVDCGGPPGLNEVLIEDSPVDPRPGEDVQCDQEQQEQERAEGRTAPQPSGLAAT